MTATPAVQVPTASFEFRGALKVLFAPESDPNPFDDGVFTDDCLWYLGAIDDINRLSTSDAQADALYQAANAGFARWSQDEFFRASKIFSAEEIFGGSF